MSDQVGNSGIVDSPETLFLGVGTREREHEGGGFFDEAGKEAVTEAAIDRGDGLRATVSVPRSPCHGLRATAASAVPTFT
jgi:hypothetical protein